MTHYSKSPRFLSLTISIVIFYAKSMGLLPFCINEKHLSLKRYRYPYAHISIYVLVFCPAIYFSVTAVVPQTFTQYSSDALKLILNVIFVLYWLTLGLTYINHYSKLADIEDIFADCVVILKTLDHLKIQIETPDLSLILIIVVQCLLTPLLQMTIVFVRLLYTDPNVDEHYPHIGMISFSSSITWIVPFVFFCLMLGACYLYRILNSEILRAMRVTSLLNSKSSFQRQKELCDLSDTLDAIAGVHLKMTEVAQRISNMVAINLLLWMIAMAGSALLVCLTAYIYGFNWAFVDGFHVPIQVFACDICSLLLTLTEAYMFVGMCATTMYEVIFISYELFQFHISILFDRHKREFKYYIVEVLLRMWIAVICKA